MVVILLVPVPVVKVIVLLTCHVPSLPGGQEGSSHAELGTS